MTAKAYVSLSTRSDESASGEFKQFAFLFSHFLHLDRDRARPRSLRFPSRQKKKKRTLGPYIFLEIPSPSVRPLIPAFLSLHLPVRFAQNEQKKKKKSLLFFFSFFPFLFSFFFFCLVGTRSTAGSIIFSLNLSRKSVRIVVEEKYEVTFER